MKSGDTFYYMSNSYIPDVHRIITIKNIREFEFVVHVDIFGKEFKTPLSYFKRVYINYDELTSWITDLSRGGLPYDRCYIIIVQKDKIDNPEYYL